MSVDAVPVASQVIANRPSPATSTDGSVASPEATALELVGYADQCGGLDNVASVLGELSEALDALRDPDALPPDARLRAGPDATSPPAAPVSPAPALAAAKSVTDFAGSVERAMEEASACLEGLAEHTAREWNFWRGVRR